MFKPRTAFLKDSGNIMFHLVTSSNNFLSINLRTLQSFFISNSGWRQLPPSYTKYVFVSVERTTNNPLKLHNVNLIQYAKSLLISPLLFSAKEKQEVMNTKQLAQSALVPCTLFTERWSCRVAVQKKKSWVTAQVKHPTPPGRDEEISKVKSSLAVRHHTCLATTKDRHLSSFKAPITCWYTGILNRLFYT